MVRNNRARSQYPPPEGPWYPTRMGAGQYPEEAHNTESSEGRGPPWTIDRALRDLCQIPGNNFFVAAERDGDIIVCSTPIGSQQLDHRRFFDKDRFISDIGHMQLSTLIKFYPKKAVCSYDANILSIKANTPAIEGAEVNFHRDINPQGPEANRSQALDRQHHGHANNAARRSNKRLRATNIQPSIPIRRNPPMKGLKIGDSDAVLKFYFQRFKSCQQLCCKILAKAWVKLIAPKKQSTNPYTGQYETRPEWWPETYLKPQSDVPERLRHREPDHLLRDERVTLLVHIVRMIVEPQHKQHPAIRALKVNVDKLEAVTFDALSTWFTDSQAPRNMSKKPILQELFKVARLEERFKDDGVDGMTSVFISTPTNKTLKEESEDEEEVNQILTPSTPRGLSVDPSTRQLMMPPIQPCNHPEGSHCQENGFPEHASIRPASYPNHEFNTDIATERPSYIDGSDMASNASSYGHNHLIYSEVYPNTQAAQGTSRRSSAVYSPSEYGSPAPSAIYSPWQHSDAPSAPSQYGGPSFGGYMVTSVDGLPTQPADPYHGNLYPTRGAGQVSLHHQNGYPTYVADSTLVGPGVKSEGGQHPSISP